MLLTLGNESGGFKLGKKRKIMSSFCCSSTRVSLFKSDFLYPPRTDLFLKLGLEDYILFGMEHNHWGS